MGALYANEPGARSSKALSRVEVKDADKGIVSAVFATFNVVDADGDVTEPDAFEEGAPVAISAYQHMSWGGALPVGKGRIRTTKAEAILDGQFFMDTTMGRDTFTIVKELGSQQQWSYGYDTVEAERGKFDGRDVQFLKRLKVHEVSPVMVGSGVNTRTLAVKALTDGGMDPSEAARIVERTVLVSDYKAAIRPHGTVVTAKSWDPAVALAKLTDDVTVDDLRKMFAWCDPSGDPTMKASYRFPHHDGPYGDANLRACMVGIADLNSGRAGIPDADRHGVYTHLTAHLRDGDRDVPEFRGLAEAGPLKFHEEAAAVLAGLHSLIIRTSEVMALRRSKGKAISASTVDILEWVYDDTRRLRSLLDSPQEDADREYARFVQSLLRPQES